MPMFLLGLLGVWNKVLAFLKVIPWQIWAAIGGVLLMLVLWHQIDSGAYKRGVAAQAVLTQREVEKNRINLASIDTLTASLNAKNAESVARAKAFADTKAADAKDVAAANARWSAADGQRRALAAIVVRPANPACKVPDGALSALEGL